MSDVVLKVENHMLDETARSKRLAFIKRHQPLFWCIDPSKITDISDAVLTEFILNYGDLNAVKELFELLGKEQVAAIFRRAVSSQRHNYFPQVANFFTLYFNAHVPEYSV